MTTTADRAGELARAFECHSARLHGRARRVLVDPHLAEEAVQEAFIRAWRAYDRFDATGGPLLPWLLVITANVAVDMARARGRRAVPTALDDARHDVPQVADAADHVALRDQLVHALRQVKPEHRAAVVEIVLRDRRPADVAAELGVNPATLRTRLHYALRQLRQLIDQAGEAA
jgi:RNA polymerase sigma-70 factor (ECF subfamily)